MEIPKLKKKFREKWEIIVCPKCKGTGQTYGYGAFGESESYSCNRCNKSLYILIKKDD